MKLLKLSRAFWETAVKYQGADKCILRHYDVLKYMEADRSMAQAAVKFNISIRQVARIKRMYK